MARILCLIICLCSFAWGHNQSLTIFLDWSIHPHHAPLFIAQYKGFFEKRGLSVTICPASSSEEGARQVSLKQAHGTLCSQPRYHFYQQKGMSLKMQGVLIPEPLEIFVLQKNHPENIGQAGSPQGFSGVVMDLIQQQHPLVKPTILRGSLVAALVQGVIDGAMDVNSTYDLALIRRHLPHAMVKPLKELGVPEFDQLIFVVHPENEEAQWIRLFLEGIGEAVQWIQAHPHDAWIVLLEMHPELIVYEDSDVWRQLVLKFTPTPQTIDLKRYETFQRFLAR